MPATSGTPEYTKTSVDDATQLAGVDATALSDGDLAFLRVTGKFYHLVRGSSAAADGVSVITTKSGVGRWLLGPASNDGAPILVANVAALAALSAAGLVQGSLAYVVTLRSYFEYEPTSALVADAISIVNATGGGQWLRTPVSNLSWSYQSSWNLDSVAGNDENAGTLAAPIKTCAELWRRLGYGAQAIISQVTTFTFSGTFTTSDPLKLSIRLNGSAFLSFIGTVTITSTGQVVAKTDLARPTLATMTGQPGFAGFVGQRCTITSGASTGANFWLERVVAGDQVETSAPVASMSTLPNSGVPTQTTIAAGAGNNYQTESLSRIDSINISLTVDNSIGTSPNFNIAYFQNLDFSQAANAPAFFGPSVVGQYAMIGCQTRPAAVQGPGTTAIYAGCRMAPNTAFGGGTHFVLAGMTLGAASTQTWQTETWVLYDQDHVFQACRLRLRRGGQTFIGTCCIQNATGDGYTAEASLCSNRSHHV